MNQDENESTTTNWHAYDTITVVNRVLSSASRYNRKKSSVEGNRSKYSVVALSAQTDRCFRLHVRVIQTIYHQGRQKL